VCEAPPPVPTHQPTALSQMHYDPYIGEIPPAPAPAPAPVETHQSSGFFDYRAAQTFVNERPWETGSVIALTVIITVQVIL